jgi:hypothetical protein
MKLLVQKATRTIIDYILDQITQVSLKLRAINHLTQCVHMYFGFKIIWIKYLLLIGYLNMGDFG